MSSNIKAHLALVGVNLIYGINFVLAKELTPAYIKPFGLIIIRAGLSTILFWVTALLLDNDEKEDTMALNPSDFRRLVACGLFGVAINQMLFFKGLSLTSPIHGSLIMITTPVLVLIMASILLKERLNARKILGISIGLAGAAFLILQGSRQQLNNASNPLGDFYIFVNAVSYGLYLVIVKPLMHRHSFFRVIKWTFLFGFCFVLPFGWREFRAIEWHTFPWGIWLILGYIVVCVTFLAYLWNTYALKFVNASTVSAYIYTQPVITTLLAVCLGKDAPNITTIGSACLIFAGVYLASAKK